ncbi:MAG: hypothetical protein M9894_24740 [Planctomycetes bacterium]|nr:hypothetical protein [Planctomycetota bacterium]
MKRSNLVVAAAAALFFVTPDVASAQQARGGPPAGLPAQGQQGQQRAQQAAQRAQQVQQVVRAYADALRQNRQAAAQHAQTLVADAQQVLMLAPAQLDALELDLEAAFDAAKDAFEALPAADQTEARLRDLIVAELNAVFATYTQDAGQLAALDAAAQKFADAVAPLELQLVQLRDQLRTQLQALRP